MGPFTKWIHSAIPDPSLKILQFILYSGLSRPQEHVYHFKYAMGLATNDEAVLCKAFPSILSDKALTWFTSLKPETINSWHDLKNSFLDKFSTAGKIPKTRGDLANIEQREGETLLAYLERIKQTYNEIEEIRQDTMITYFEGGFQSKMLFYKIQV